MDPKVASTNLDMSSVAEMVLESNPPEKFLLAVEPMQQNRTPIPTRGRNSRDNVYMVGNDQEDPFNFNSIPFHFPNCFEPLMLDENENEIHKAFHNIYRDLPYPDSQIRYPLISNESVIDGVDCMLTQLEVERYGKMERRLELLGCNFRIVENKSQNKSLFRAISQAICGDEGMTQVIRNAVIKNITGVNFQYYRNDLVRSYMEVIPALTRSFKDRKIIKAYTRYLRRHKEAGSTFELHAASVIFSFAFGVVVLWKNNELVVINCSDRKLKDQMVKFYFLQTGKEREDFHFEFLAPIGIFVDPPDGLHQIILKQILKVPERNPFLTIPKTFVPNIPEHLNTYVFSLEDEVELFYHDTKSHDLFEVLSEILFGDTEQGKDIKKLLDEKRHNLDHFLRSPVVRESHVPLRGALKPYTTHRMLYQHRRKTGDTIYLKLAAAEFKFSAIAIGLDTCGNFHVTKMVHYDKKAIDELGSMPEVPFYYFFVRHSSNYTRWHLLHLNTEVRQVLLTLQNPTDTDSPDLACLLAIFNSKTPEMKTQKDFDQIRQIYKMNFYKLHIWNKKTKHKSKDSLSSKSDKWESRPSLFTTIDPNTSVAIPNPKPKPKPKPSNPTKKGNFITRWFKRRNKVAPMNESVNNDNPVSKRNSKLDVSN